VSSTQPVAGPTVFDPRIIDARSDPARVNELARDATKPALPLMGDLPSNTTTLPGGYLDKQGVLHREARIREINGADEEAMARELRNPTVNVAKVVDLLLKRTVLAVGDIEPVPAWVLGDMLTGDRAALMLAVRILTFGSDWEVPDFPCRLCGQSFGTIVELDSIPIRDLDNPMVQEVEVELRNGHLANVGMLTGAAQLEMVGDGNRTGPEEVTIAIDRCLRAIDGNPVAGAVAQKMSMADRRTIAKAMADAQPGPRMEEVMVTCTKCDREADYTVSLVDLFR
jgi:hypothetical protein